MSDPSLPPIQPYHPITFIERGVAVPFTTPSLSGARARPNQRFEVELILPNPSGTRGVYILGWRNVRELFSATLHDELLNERIIKLPAITPASIRSIAQVVASKGLAGDEVTDAARAAVRADRQSRLLVNFLLLETLVEQVESRIGMPRNTGVVPKMPMEMRAQRAIAWIAPPLGQQPNAISIMLEGIASALTHIGFGRQADQARIPRVLLSLHHMCEELNAWVNQPGNLPLREYVDVIVDVAQLTLTLAKKTLRDVLPQTADAFDLLRRWIANPHTLADLAARPEWLLDGWEEICLLWQMADDRQSYIGAILKMARLIPILPREAADWVGDDIINRRERQRMGMRRIVPINQDWLTGSKVFAMVARNERLRARGFGFGLRAA